MKSKDGMLGVTDYNMRMDTVRKTLKMVQDIEKGFGNGVDLKHDMEKVHEYVKALFERAKFREGDHVMLKNDPGINMEDRPGWMSFQHCMKVGSGAVIRSVDYDEGVKDFTYFVTFDSLSIIHRGKELPCDDGGVFGFDEKDLSPFEGPHSCCGCDKEEDGNWADT